MYPLVMSWTISQPSNKVLPSSSTCPVLQQGFNLELRLSFNLHWWWWLFRSTSRQVGLQLGDMEDIVNPCEVSLKVKLVLSLAHALEDLERAHKPLTKLTYNRQMQVADAQQHPVPNLMLLVPVMMVKVPLLVLLRLQQVSLGSLKQVLDVQGKVSSPSMATSLDHHIQW